MSDFTSIPVILLALFACAAYATFLWVNFKQGRYVMLWSSAGIVLMQTLSAFSTANVAASLAAAGFHAALVASIYTGSKSKKTVKNLVPVKVRHTDSE